MNFALVRFWNTHVHSVEREEEQPSGGKPTIKTATSAVSEAADAQMKFPNTNMWREDGGATANDECSSRGAPDAQTAHAHTRTKRYLKIYIYCKWPWREHLW